MSTDTNSLPEDQARFYSVEILTGLVYMHRHFITVTRTIKDTRVKDLATTTTNFQHNI